MPHASTSRSAKGRRRWLPSSVRRRWLPLAVDCAMAATDVKRVAATDMLKDWSNQLAEVHGKRAARDLCGVAVGVRSSGLQSALPAGLPTSQPLSELNCQQRAAHLRICRLSSRICRPRRSRAPLAATGWAWGTGGVARGEGGWSHWPTEGIVGGGALWLHHIAAWRRWLSLEGAGAGC